MKIERINDYDDDRFSQIALFQHGCYLINGQPYEVIIDGSDSAVIKGENPDHYGELIEKFLFHAPHVSHFRDITGNIIACYPRRELLTIGIDDIQPSQFYVDEDKLTAVSTFINSAEDIIIQIQKDGNGFISLDGHSRLYLAVERGYDHVKAVLEESDGWLQVFVDEARRRGVYRPSDMVLLPHEEYEIRWNQYCDEVFSNNTMKE